MLARARAYSHVKTVLPAFFNPLFRKQGPINGLLLDAVHDLNNALAAVSEQARSSSSQTASALSALHEAVSLTNERIRSVISAAGALELRLASQTAELAELERLIWESRQSAYLDSEKAREEIARLEAQSLTQDKAHENRIAQLESELNTLRATLAGNEGSFARLQAHVVQLQSAHDDVQANINARVDQLVAATHATNVQMEGALGRLAGRISDIAEAQRALKAELEDAACRASQQLPTPFTLAMMNAIHGSIQVLGNRLADLEALAAAEHPNVEGDNPPPDSSVAIYSAPAATPLSEFYLAFEDRFRGTRGEIKEKQRVYLPEVQSAASRLSIAPADLRLLDIGCGRGEWLELLTSNGFRRAAGIDSNPAMVRTCQAIGLTVTHADLGTFLSEIEPGSIHVVSAFHVIEHLAYVHRFELYRSIARILAKGGLALFETPNPENIIVGACNFYFDPTHQRPLIPVVEEFTLREIGFSDIRTLRLNPFATAHHAQTPDGDVTRQFNQFFYGPQDFGLVCIK